MIINYEITKLYVINFVEYNFITKILKRSFNWIKSNLRKFMIAAITFIIIMISAVAEAEKVHIIKVTFYNTPEIKSSIFVVIRDFFFMTKYRKYQKRV